MCNDIYYKSNFTTVRTSLDIFGVVLMHYNKHVIEKNVLSFKLRSELRNSMRHK